MIRTGEFKGYSEFMVKSNTAIAEVELSGLQRLGVKKAVQYGFQTGQLQKLSVEENEANLSEVQKFVKLLLQSANKNLKRTIKNTSDLSK